MIYRRTARFKKAYQTLPPEIRQKVTKAFTLFQTDPGHPSLGIKKMQGHASIWEERIDQQYHFTFCYETTQTGETLCVFRNVDNHDECLKNP